MLLEQNFNLKRSNYKYILKIVINIYNLDHHWPTTYIQSRSPPAHGTNMMLNTEEINFRKCQGSLETIFIRLVKQTILRRQKRKYKNNMDRIFSDEEAVNAKQKDQNGI